MQRCLQVCLQIVLDAAQILKKPRPENTAMLVFS